MSGMVPPSARLSTSVLVGIIAVPVLGALLNGWYTEPVYDYSHALFWVTDFFFFALFPAIAVFWLNRTAGVAPCDYGLRSMYSDPAELIVASLFFAIILGTVYFVTNAYAFRFSPFEHTRYWYGYGALIPKSGMDRVLSVGYLSMSAGFTESLFYIGLPWYLWKTRLNLGKYRGLFLVGSALIFAFAHWEQGFSGILSSFAFGLTACLIYWKVATLWPIIVAHALVDFVLFLR